MQSFVLSRDAARLVILQRIELASPNLKRIRKLFGRYLFSKIFSKYSINPKIISKNYHDIMKNEFLTIKHFVSHNNKVQYDDSFAFEEQFNEQTDKHSTINEVSPISNDWNDESYSTW